MGGWEGKWGREEWEGKDGTGEKGKEREGTPKCWFTPSCSKF